MSDCGSPEICESPGGTRRSIVGRPSLNRPASKQYADGKEAKKSTLVKVRTKVVECDERGQPVPKDAEFTHYKTTFERFEAKEFRALDGIYTGMQVTFSKEKAVRELFVQLGSESLEKHAVSGLTLLLAKGLLSLPHSVTLSIDYTSPNGGDWFVDGFPLVLNTGSENGGGCCTLQ